MNTSAKLHKNPACENEDRAIAKISESVAIAGVGEKARATKPIAGPRKPIVCMTFRTRPGSHPVKFAGTRKPKIIR